ncbi:MAG: hypothetical protein NTZ16_15665, partial [Verrucomicrobia bacterium]|nr:hypothetical protein [Verrucomicrobiota bacterium]
PTNGTLAVVSGTATTATNLEFNLSGSTLALGWPESHRGWFAQSNSVNVAGSNYWFDITGSDAVTNLNITISPAATNVFYRLRAP